MSLIKLPNIFFYEWNDKYSRLLKILFYYNIMIFVIKEEKKEEEIIIW